jgi:hypothetical protein
VVSAVEVALEALSARIIAHARTTDPGALVSGASPHVCTTPLVSEWFTEGLGAAVTRKNLGT